MGGNVQCMSGKGKPYVCGRTHLSWRLMLACPMFGGLAFWHAVHDNASIQAKEQVQRGKAPTSQGGGGGRLWDGRRPRRRGGRSTGGGPSHH